MNKLITLTIIFILLIMPISSFALLTNGGTSGGGGDPECTDTCDPCVGHECGIQICIDDCGESHSVSCGSCPTNYVCSTGTCVKGTCDYSPSCTRSDEKYCNTNGQACTTDYYTACYGGCTSSTSCNSCPNGCSNGQCVLDQTCTPDKESYKQCYNGDVWWFDDCDDPYYVYSDCAEMCYNAECVECIVDSDCGNTECNYCSTSGVCMQRVDGSSCSSCGSSHTKCVCNSGSCVDSGGYCGDGICQTGHETSDNCPTDCEGGSPDEAIYDCDPNEPDCPRTTCSYEFACCPDGCDPGVDCGPYEYEQICIDENANNPEPAHYVCKATSFGTKIYCGDSPEEECTCSNWVAQGCGGGSCSEDEMYYTRSCDNNCDIESTCSINSECEVCTVTDTCASTECYNGDLWCFDNCNNPDHIQEECEMDCVDGQCVECPGVEICGEIYYCGEDDGICPEYYEDASGNSVTCEGVCSDPDCQGEPFDVYDVIVRLPDVDEGLIPIGSCSQNCYEKQGFSSITGEPQLTRGMDLDFVVNAENQLGNECDYRSCDAVYEIDGETRAIKWDALSEGWKGTIDSSTLECDTDYTITFNVSSYSDYDSKKIDIHVRCIPSITITPNEKSFSLGEKVNKNIFTVTIYNPYDYDFSNYSLEIDPEDKIDSSIKNNMKFDSTDLLETSINAPSLDSETVNVYFTEAERMGSYNLDFVLYDNVGSEINTETAKLNIFSESLSEFDNWKALLLLPLLLLI